MELFENEDYDLVDNFININNDNYKVKLVNVPRRIGFDRIIVRCRLINVDWAVFEKRKDRCRFYTADSVDKALTICQSLNKPQWYKQIEIYVTANNVFKIKKCNLPNQTDICSFEIVVSPIKGHEKLGNITNMNCYEEQNRVRALFDKIADYGFYLDKDYAIISSVELNVNLLFNSKLRVNDRHNTVIDLLRSFVNYLDKYKDIDFFEPDSKSARMIEKISIESQIYHPLDSGFKDRRDTGFREISKNKTVDISVYDKGIEVINKSDGVISEMSPLIRIEFLIRRQDKILTCFKRKNNLFELDQDDIEYAFHMLVRNLMFENYVKYRSDIYKSFESTFEGLDINTRRWRKKLVNQMDHAVEKHRGSVLITKDFLRQCVGLMHAKSIPKKGSEVNKSLIKEFNEYAQNIIVSDVDYIDELFVYLGNLKCEENQVIKYILKEG